MVVKKTYRKFSNFMKQWDEFGYHVQVPFNDKPESHNTCIGGFATVLIWAFMIVYIW